MTNRLLLIFDFDDSIEALAYGDAALTWLRGNTSYQHYRKHNTIPPNIEIIKPKEIEHFNKSKKQFEMQLAAFTSGINPEHITIASGTARSSKLRDLEKSKEKSYIIYDTSPNGYTIKPGLVAFQAFKDIASKRDWLYQEDLVGDHIWSPPLNQWRHRKSYDQWEMRGKELIIQFAIDRYFEHNKSSIKKGDKTTIVFIDDKADKFKYRLVTNLTLHPSMSFDDFHLYTYDCWDGYYVEQKINNFNYTIAFCRTKVEEHRIQLISTLRSLLTEPSLNASIKEILKKSSPNHELALINKLSLDPRLIPPSNISYIDPEQLIHTYENIYKTLSHHLNASTRSILKIFTKYINNTEPKNRSKLYCHIWENNAASIDARQKAYETRAINTSNNIELPKLNQSQTLIGPNHLFTLPNGCQRYAKGQPPITADTSTSSRCSVM